MQDTTLQSRPTFWRLALPLAVLLTLAIAAPASAWEGAKIVSVSCPEVHLWLPQEQGKWRVVVTQDTGQVLLDQQVTGGTNTTVGGLWTTDALEHVVTVEVGNAADLRDGYVKRQWRLVNCAPPLGTPGPVGPVGPQGPAGPPSAGTNTDTTRTIVVRNAPDRCTSKRSYRFHVRRAFEGSKVVAAKGTEPGVKVTTRKRNGRFVVSWSTAGKTYPRGGVIRSVTVHARLANGRHINFVWQYRPCLKNDGNLNDPPASDPSGGNR